MAWADKRPLEADPEAKYKKFNILFIVSYNLNRKDNPETVHSY